MKKLALSILAALAAMPLVASAADATLYADVMSAYVYRGVVGNDQAVFQPGLDVAGPYGFGYSLWANMNLTDAESAWYPDTFGKWGEVDLGLNWTCPAEGVVGLTVGATYFLYPQDSSEVLADEATGEPLVDAEGNVQVSAAPADDGYELYAEFSAADVPLAPSLKLCHDLENGDDWIIIAGIGHTFGLTDELTLDFGASLGYAGKYYVASNYGSDTGDALSHAQVDAALNYAVSETVSVGLKGSVSTLLDADLRDDVDAEGYYPETDIFFGGVSASYSF